MNCNGAMISYAQNREDVLLARVFREVAQGFYVDVGANDPVHCSVTKHFYDQGWHGINLEPGRIFEQLAAARPRDLNLNLAASDQAGVMTFYEYLEGVYHGLSSLHPELPGDDAALSRRIERQVEVRPLREIFAEFAPPRIDFMSVDVEQHERQVLLGNDWSRYRPRVVLVEATQPRSSAPAHHGWEPILLNAGYSFVYFDGLNRYYLRHEDAALADRFATPPNVFDNYVLASTVELHQRIASLLKEIERLNREIHAKNVELARIDQAYQQVEQAYLGLIAGTSEGSLQTGLWLARQMTRVSNAAARLTRRAA